MRSTSKQQRDQRHDAKRRAEKPWRKLYATKRWQQIRAHQLAMHPLCQRCLAAQPTRITPATVVHHVDRHEGDPIKFFAGPFASSCVPCHDAIEQGIEVRGYDTSVDANGMPTDPHHPWNAEG